jgi:hypothetical protein
MPKIKFYKTQNGKSPVEEFLDSLNDRQVRKVAWVLRSEIALAEKRKTDFLRRKK